jgi:sodium-dependent dicarboxylate transporter 2/3/5
LFINGYILEALPIAVTSLFPVAFFPFFEILKADEVSSSYFNDTIFLFIGSFILALAMEKWNLHRRIALKILTYIGNRTRSLLLAFMLVTAFLSMWMSNTSTAGVMVPLVMTTLKKLKEMENNSNQNNKNNENVNIEMENLSDNNEENNFFDKNKENNFFDKNKELEINNLINLNNQINNNEINNNEINNNLVNNQNQNINKYAIAMLLGIAYSCSLGGTATIIGTGPNLIFKSQMKILFPKSPDITFLQWFVFACPLALIFLILVWLFLIFFVASNSSKINFDRHIFILELRKMGKMKFSEIMILIDLGLMAILWFTRVGFGDGIFGWEILFKKYPGDGSVAMLLSLLLFIIPSFNSNGSRIMDWESTKELPWGIILLLGSGFALSKGFIESGLSQWIGEVLKILGVLPSLVLVFSICIIITFATEITSNVATANISLPILASISITIHENPMLLMIPATISCSYAFMLPVATPPNAIVFSSGMLTILDMIKSGIFMNLIGIILLPTWMYIFGIKIFDIDIGELPSWVYK